VPGPDPAWFLSSPGLFAYGPVPGVELIPYFLGLVAWAALAFAAVLLAPFAALLRRLRRAGPAAPPGPEGPPTIPPLPEAPGEGDCA
jgi:hypothetical protein